MKALWTGYVNIQSLSAEDIVLGGLGAVATVATGGLADAAMGAIGSATEGIGASLEGAAASDETGIGTRVLGSVKKSGASLYKNLPGRTKVAEGILGEAGSTIFTDEVGDVTPPPGDTDPTPAPPPDETRENQYNSNYQSLFGHLHDQPFTGSVWS